jgi:hypothetical protein
MLKCIYSSLEPVLIAPIEGEIPGPDQEWTE